MSCGNPIHSNLVVALAMSARTLLLSLSDQNTSNYEANVWTKYGMFIGNLDTYTTVCECPQITVDSLHFALTGFLECVASNTQLVDAQSVCMEANAIVKAASCSCCLNRSDSAVNINQSVRHVITEIREALNEIKRVVNIISYRGINDEKLIQPYTLAAETLQTALNPVESAVQSAVSDLTRNCPITQSKADFLTNKVKDLADAESAALNAFDQICSTCKAQWQTELQRIVAEQNTLEMLEREKHLLILKVSGVREKAKTLRPEVNSPAKIVFRPTCPAENAKEELLFEISMVTQTYLQDSDLVSKKRMQAIEFWEEMKVYERRAEEKLWERERAPLAYEIRNYSFGERGNKLK